MNNLYTFSKNAWHVRLFKWIYNTDPTTTFNTMCPYFWSLVSTMTLLPIILIVKLFGRAGTNLLSKLESYKRDKQAAEKESFLQRCNKDLTDEQAYKIKNTSCWDRNYYFLEWELEKEIRSKAYNHRDFIFAQKEIKKQKITEVKESKYFIYSSYVISVIVVSLGVYGLYYSLSLIEYSPIDWEFLGKLLKVVLFAISILVAVYLLCKYVIFPIYERISCMECKLCQYGYVLSPFKFIGRGILIICDMIYMTYKQACPRITWKNK